MCCSTEVRLILLGYFVWVEKRDVDVSCSFVLDLLKHTPASSPSRALVERALEAASKIAQRCDRAQGNSAFLRM